MKTETKHTPLDRLKHHVTGAIERGEKTAIVGQPTNRCSLPFSPEALKLLRWIISDNDEEIAKGDLLRTKEGREVFLLAKDIQLVLNESEELATLRADKAELLEACKTACAAAADCLPIQGERELDALYYKSKLLVIDNAASKLSALITKHNKD